MSLWNWLNFEFAPSFSWFILSSASVSACHFCFSFLTNCLVSSDHSNFSHDWIAFLSYHFLSFLHLNLPLSTSTFINTLTYPLLLWLHWQFILFSLNFFIISMVWFEWFCNEMVFSKYFFNEMYPIWIEWNVLNWIWLNCTNPIKCRLTIELLFWIKWKSVMKHWKIQVEMILSFRVCSWKTLWTCILYS